MSDSGQQRSAEVPSGRQEELQDGLDWRSNSDMEPAEESPVRRVRMDQVGNNPGVKDAGNSVFWRALLYLCS